MGMTQKRVRRYAECHSVPSLSAESLILTPRKQRTEDLIFGRGKVIGDEKGRALPIQYQECKNKLQNRLIKSIKSTILKFCPWIFGKVFKNRALW